MKNLRKLRKTMKNLRKTRGEASGRFLGVFWFVVLRVLYHFARYVFGRWAIFSQIFGRGGKFYQNNSFKFPGMWRCHLGGFWHAKSESAARRRKLRDPEEKIESLKVLKVNFSPPIGVGVLDFKKSPLLPSFLLPPPCQSIKMSIKMSMETPIEM